MITGRLLHQPFIKNLAVVKKAAAITNEQSGQLDIDLAKAIIQACDEIIEGELREEFIVDAIQGGAGTSANMNANEVIANRAIEILGGIKGNYNLVHPNDHVNMAQSTNDVIPSAGKLTVLELLDPLIYELEQLEKALYQKSLEFDKILKMGRTEMQDAVPMRLGQAFHAYYSAVQRDIRRIRTSATEMYSMNMGGTAIGSAINVSLEYFHNIVPVLAEITGYPLTQAEDLFDSTSNPDGFVVVSDAIKCCAVNIAKMSNDLRLLSSGPKTGIGEINLPAVQNGSSIMPGKVNPVIPEVVAQVAYQVIGSNVTITMAAEAGQMELNAFEPVIFYSLFESILAMTRVVNTLTENCILGITANEDRCRELLESSVGISTALCPHIGYKKAAEIAKESLKSGISIRKLVLQEGLLSDAELDKILDPYAMTEISHRY
jgi:aspartate ammonia-lyase